MRRLCKCLILLAALTVCNRSYAQVLPFVAADFNPASVARAGASYSDTDNVAYSAFDAPAAMAFYDGKADFSAGYVMWQPGSVKTNVVNVAGMYKIAEKFSVSAGFMYGMQPKYDVMDASGKQSGTFMPSQMQAGVGFSWSVLPYLALGADVNYAANTLSKDVTYGTVVADVQMMAVFGGFKASVGVSDLGGKVASSNGTAFSLPTSVRAGVSYDVCNTEKHNLDVAADAQYYFDGAIAAAVGTSYTFNDLLSVKAGYRYGGTSVIPSHASVGAGVKVSGVKIDLAYVIASSPMANTLAVSLGYSF